MAKMVGEGVGPLSADTVAVRVPDSQGAVEAAVGCTNMSMVT